MRMRECIVPLRDRRKEQAEEIEAGGTDQFEGVDETELNALCQVGCLLLQQRVAESAVVSFPVKLPYCFLSLEHTQDPIQDEPEDIYLQDLVEQQLQQSGCSAGSCTLSHEIFPSRTW